MHNLIGYRTTLSFFFCQSVITLLYWYSNFTDRNSVTNYKWFTKKILQKRHLLPACHLFGILIPKYFANYSGIQESRMKPLTKHCSVPYKNWDYMIKFHAIQSQTRKLGNFDKLLSLDKKKHDWRLQS